MAKKDRLGRYSFTKTPQFLSGEKLSPAQRGDALHQFMQYADYARCAQNAEEELQRLLELEFLTPVQAQLIHLEKVRHFFACGIYRRMAAARRMERELRFFWDIDSRQMGYDGAGADKITVQGVSDCVFWEAD